MADFLDPELDLLGDDLAPGDEADAAANHALRTAPLITGDAYEEVGYKIFPQRALYGRIVSQHSSYLPEHPRSAKVYVNTNAPFSALVCGVQGSGKSHSTSVLLESCLMKDERIGTLPAPLSALVFHYDTAAGGGLVQPCEAAYLSAVDRTRSGDEVMLPQVTVLVVPTYLKAMRKVYAGLPWVTVEPLLFAPDDISGERLLAMMKVDENTQMPLYMESIMAILRSMEDNFDYKEFRQQLAKQRFNGSQKAMLNLRLALLDSCLSGGDTSNCVKNHFKQGQLTIVDLSSPFMDGTSACGFFDIILGLFVESEVGASGKLVVLDEAHKYLSETQTGSSARLTESLLTVIRQQRHLATRVVISTQEPTVVPSKFLDLCSIIIAHRFSSPKWLRVLAQHVSAADSSLDELFEKIVSLQTGQAIIFAPNGLGVRSSSSTVSAHPQAETGAEPHRTQSRVAPLGQGYLIVRSRLRLTLDGGHSLLAVSTPGLATRLGRVSGRETTPTVSVLGPADATTPSSHHVPLQSMQSNHLHERPPAPAPAQDSLPPLPAVPTPELRMEPVSQTASQKINPVPSVQTTNLEVNNSTTSLPSQSNHSQHLGAPSVNQSSATQSKLDIHLTGDRRRFAPMVKFLQERLKIGQRDVAMQSVRKHFRKKDPEIYGVKPTKLNNIILDAINAGVIINSVVEKHVELVHDANYHFEKSSSHNVISDIGQSSSSEPWGGFIYMSGERAQFTPLVKYAQAELKKGCNAIATKRIRNHFRKKRPEVYGNDPAVLDRVILDAVRSGVLTDSKYVEKHVILVEGARYIFGSSSGSVQVQSGDRATSPGSTANGSQLSTPPASPRSPTTSPNFAPQVKASDGEAAYFSPLVRYVQGNCSSGRVGIGEIVRHFRDNEPTAFGATAEIVYKAVIAALQTGILANAGAKWVRLR